MRKISVTFWFGEIYPCDKQVYDKHSSSFLTILFTPPTEMGSHLHFQVLNNGVCVVPCDNYEVIGKGSAINWTDHFQLEFAASESGTALAVAVKERDVMCFDMPVVEEY